MDDGEYIKYSESPSDKIEEANDNLLATISEKDKIAKEYINTQKVTNTSNLISQLELSRRTEILLESKIPTDVSLFSGTGPSVTPEIRISIKK